MSADPIRCPACGGRLIAWRSMAASDPVLRGQRFALQRCTTCGSAVTSDPAPAGLHDCGAYGGGTPRLHRLAAPVLARFDARRLALLRPFAPPPGRLLDVGAGRGRFVRSARLAGYEARGLEPSARGHEAAAALDAPVDRVSVEQAEIASGSLDAVTVWHVLEHLDDPGEALERIRLWLRPGGVLLVGVPNLASLQARLGGPRWYHLDLPRHRIHFTVPGVHALLERHGYVIRRTEHVLAEHNSFGMWQSLVNRLTRTPSYLYNLLKRNAALGSADLAITLLALPLAPVAAFVELVAAAAGRGGTVAVVAQTLGPAPGGPE